LRNKGSRSSNINTNTRIFTNKEETYSTSINTDEREPFDWKTKYPIEARKQMRYEAIYLAVLFVMSFTLLLINCLGKFKALFTLTEEYTYQLEYFIYFSSSGLLGGVIFGMKYFYRVIARGYWTQDRIYWRIFSPFISMSVACIVGVMASSGILTTHNNASSSGAIAVGFFAGYFADEAVGKMYEIATLLFGKTKKE